MEYKNNLADLKNMLGQKRKSPNTIEDINKNPSEDVIMEPVLEGEKVSKIKKNNNLLPKNKDNNNINNKQNEEEAIVQDIDININEDKEDKADKKKSEDGNEINNNMTVSPKRGKANTNEKKKSEKVIFFF